MIRIIINSFNCSSRRKEPSPTIERESNNLEIYIREHTLNKASNPKDLYRIGACTPTFASNFPFVDKHLSQVPKDERYRKDIKKFDSKFNLEESTANKPILFQQKNSSRDFDVNYNSRVLPKVSENKTSHWNINTKNEDKHEIPRQPHAYKPIFIPHNHRENLAILKSQNPYTMDSLTQDFLKLNIHIDTSNKINRSTNHEAKNAVYQNKENQGFNYRTKAQDIPSTTQSSKENLPPIKYNQNLEQNSRPSSLSLNKIRQDVVERAKMESNNKGNIPQFDYRTSKDLNPPFQIPKTHLKDHNADFSKNQSRLKQKIERKANEYQPDKYRANISVKKDDDQVSNKVDGHQKPSKEKPAINSHKQTEKPKTMQKPILIPEGLPNIGNTCYMNAVLQCLINAPLFPDKLVEEYQNNTKLYDKKSLTRMFVTLILRLKCPSKPTISKILLIDLKTSLASDNKAFGSYGQQDAEDFLSTLLNQLNEDLVNDLFCGKFRNLIKCKGCGQVTSKIEEFLNIPLSMKESHENNIYALINAFLSEETLKKGFYCNTCESVQDCQKKTIIYSLPQILVIHLKRFQRLKKGYKKIGTKVAFPVDTLNLAYFIDDSRYHPAVDTQYTLFGFANHEGSVDGGHYTAVCVDDSTKKWYNFDDTFVREERVNKETISNAAPMMLFYIRKACL